MAERRYIYDPGWEQERARLARLEVDHDPYTILHCERIGIADGWRCLEVGGGGGSVTAWLSARVGPTGTVVATDLDTRFLEALDAANVEVRRHDIVRDPLETDAFDLVHARFVLEHVPERETVLDTLIAAARPGGWLLIEDVDFTDMVRPDDMLASTRAVPASYFAALRAFVESRGVDATYGGALPGRLIARGLEDVGAATHRVLMRGGAGAATVAKLSTLAMKDGMVAGGFATQDEVDAVLAALDAPETLALSPTTVSAWGRKP